MKNQIRVPEFTRATEASEWGWSNINGGRCAQWFAQLHIHVINREFAGKTLDELEDYWTRAYGDER